MLDRRTGPDAPEWFRRAMAQEPERSTVDHDGISLETLSWGPRGAPGILLLHGFRAHADWWDHIAPFLAGDHRVTAMSLAGMGRSSWREAYSIEGHAADAMAVAEASGLFEASRPPIVIAHSFGGYVGARIAATYGNRLTGAVLIDVSINPNPATPPPDGRARVWATRQEAEARLRLTPKQDALDYVLANFARHAVHEINDGDRTGWTWRFDPMLSARTPRNRGWDALPKAQCPLAIIRGEHSTLVPEETATAQQARAPDGTMFVTIPDASHHILADQPLALVSSLRTIISCWRSAG